MDDTESGIAMFDPSVPLAAPPSDIPWSPDSLADCHSSLRDLYNYWNARRGARLMPARGDIDPVDLKALLPMLILIDVVADARRYIYRLVGTGEVEMRGRDPTGKSILEGYYGESADDTIFYLDRVVQSREPLLYRGTYQPMRTRTQQEDLLFLPLSNDGAVVNMVLLLSHIAWLKDDALA